jgi:hypothetical protein
MYTGSKATGLDGKTRSEKTTSINQIEVAVWWTRFAYMEGK